MRVEREIRKVKIRGLKGGRREEENIYKIEVEGRRRE